MTISITEFAEEKISNILKKNNMKLEDTYLRVGLKGGGCSGLSYVFDFTTKTNEDDKIFNFNKVNVCLDKKSYLFLNGMEIDFEETPFKSGIKINNPMAKRSCGCGESFSI
tara:strand:+ start:128 stop:460 length:333 start_codon:yes stop_codon:yes gene_type:complete